MCSLRKPAILTYELFSFFLNKKKKNTGLISQDCFKGQTQQNAPNTL